MLHGIGGVGKSTLAAEVLRSLGGDAGLVVSRAGQVSVDDVLGETGARLQLAASAAEGGDRLAQAGLVLRAADVEWADRWRLLAEQILPAAADDRAAGQLRRQPDTKPMTAAGRCGDPELAAFLAGWARRPGQSRLAVHLPVPVRAARFGRAAAGRSCTWGRCRRPRRAS